MLIASRVWLGWRLLIKLDVDQFYGIEIEEFPAQIAQVALWLMDHQMNLQVSEEFGLYFARIPLSASSTIVCGNALRVDWNDVVPAEKLSFIMGNPPFLGKQYQSKEQKIDLELVCAKIKNFGLLDFVAGWYIKAKELCLLNKSIQCAFVSTNSITQGEQVSVLWPSIINAGLKINFAHRTFNWNNEAKGRAAVHCVIVGFGYHAITTKLLFDYQDIKGESTAISVKNINPYLVDAPDLFLPKLRAPICDFAPLMAFGSMPNDGGFLILSDSERAALIKQEPLSEKYIHLLLGSEEFLNNLKRYCLWLEQCSPSDLKMMPEVLKRVQSVKSQRLSSNRAATKKLAETPTLFGEIRQPKNTYIAFPEVSSGSRFYIPVGFLSAEIISTNKLYTIDLGSVYHFGVLQSLMHMSWVRAISGRFKSDYQYSSGLVYNNFPWPENPTEKQTQTIEAAAQAVLDARAQFPESSLADLYDPLTMPPVLLKAHQTLDKAVDAAYGKTNFKTEAERVAFLFELYQKYTSLLPVERVKKGRKKAEG